MSETKFIKTKKERNFTVVDNTYIKDVSLSWKAKGLMTYLLSLPDDWNINISEIETHATDGRDSLRSAVCELKEHGYLQAIKTKTDKGQFSGIVYLIVENPISEKPETENPLADNPKLQNTDYTKYEFKQNTDEFNKSKKKSQKKNSKAELFNRVDDYTDNKELKDVLKQYLQFKLNNCKGFSLSQWDIQLELLSQFANGDLNKAIEKVKLSYAANYQSLVYPNELNQRNTYQQPNSNVKKDLDDKSGWL